VSQEPFRYTGKERDDETGLFYYGARYYGPWLGRWTAADPIGIKDGPCVFAYVSNNPINRFDPSGMEGEEDDPEIHLTPPGHSDSPMVANAPDLGHEAAPWTDPTLDPLVGGQSRPVQTATPGLNASPTGRAKTILTKSRSSTPTPKTPIPFPHETPEIPSVSPPDKTLYFEEGYAWKTYQSAVGEASNPNNPAWVRGVFAGLGMMATPVAAAEKAAQIFLNTPNDVYNAGIKSGEYAARGSLLEGDEAVIEYTKAFHSATEFVSTAGSAAGGRWQGRRRRGHYKENRRQKLPFFFGF